MAGSGLYIAALIESTDIYYQWTLSERLPELCPAVGIMLAAVIVSETAKYLESRRKK